MTLFRILHATGYLLVSIAVTGCLSLLSAVTAPSVVALDEDFVICIDGVVSGSGGGMASLIMQLPDSISFLGASYICSSARRPLRRSYSIAAQYMAEEGHSILALADSISYSRDNSDTIRAFIRLKARSLGTYTVKFLTGAIEIEDEKTAWKLCDPPNIRDFRNLVSPRFLATFTVVDPEKNGTVGLLFSGNREYVLLPDTGLFAFTLDRDFSIETWMQTTARDVILFSTRTDDFRTAYPLEIALTAYGSVQVSASDGKTLFTTENRIFLCDGLWHHVGLSYASRESRYFLTLDGVLRDSVTLSGKWMPVKKYTAVVGMRASKSKFFSGQLDELRFWSAIRSPEQFNYYRTIALTGYETDLYAMYSFDKVKEGKLINTSQNEGLEATAFNRPKLVLSTAPMKVELLSFGVSLQGMDIQLFWETFDESNVKVYQVEKRSESSKFSVLYNVPPQRDLSNHQTYAFQDIWKDKTITYYRLRKINFDGSMIFSDEIPVGAELILNFSLEDNEPNPFNSETHIRYTLSESTFVSLWIYDIMGREVEQLVSEKQDAGDYEVLFDGSSLPAGMYFYKMRTNTGAQTKKMYLSK